MLLIDTISDRKYWPNREDFLLGQREYYVIDKYKIFINAWLFFDELYFIASFDYPKVRYSYDTIVWTIVYGLVTIHLDFQKDFYQKIGFRNSLRGKSRLESWCVAFVYDWQPPLIFVRFTSNFLSMCSDRVASTHVILM